MPGRRLVPVQPQFLIVFGFWRLVFWGSRNACLTPISNRVWRFSGMHFWSKFDHAVCFSRARGEGSGGKVWITVDHVCCFSRARGEGSGTNFWSTFDHDFCNSLARGEGSGSNFWKILTNFFAPHRQGAKVRGPTLEQIRPNSTTCLAILESQV